MKKSKLSKLMLIIAMIITICCVSSIINASSPVTDLIQDIPELPDGNNTPTTPIGGNNTPKTNTNRNVAPISGNTNRNITANTALPKTGVNDTMLWVLIGISAVAAVYTYKKVRDYNA